MKELDYDLIFNSIDEGILTVDQQFTITSLNHSAAALTGWNKDEIIGRRFHDVFNQFASFAIQKCLEQGISAHASMSLLMAKDGCFLPAMVSTMPMKDRQGKIAGAIVIFYDQKKLYPNFSVKFQQMGLVGSSTPMKEVFQLIEMVAPTHSIVLINGPTGTGKELIANSIHQLSPRKDQPFVKVNCASLSENLLESELFGHEQGAFTGAIKQRIGRFELADHGTLFLDEIAEISPAFQAKLLRVIQEGSFERVGSSDSLFVDVRVITATNKDLGSMVEKNDFRADLYYRLNVFPILVPSLAERKSDLKILVEYFINEFNMKFEHQKVSISDDALRFLQNYSFPGNVRELRNIVEYTFIRSREPILEHTHFPAYLLDESGQDIPLDKVRTGHEAEHIQSVLEACQGNKTEAAKRLNISRRTLYNKLNKE